MKHMKHMWLTALAVSFLIGLLSATPAFAGTWTKGEENTWTYLNDDGESVTGWIEDDGKTYYLDDDGVLKTGWFRSKGSWYYFSENGILEKDKWIDNYYVNSEGKLKDIR